MNAYDHVVMRCKLNIAIPDTSYREIVYNSLRNYLEQQLPILINEILSIHVPEDIVINLDRLHIPLPHLPYKGLEVNFIDQLNAQLPTVVENHIKAVMQDPSKRHITPLPQAKLKALEHYLKHGYFAWWIPEGHGTTSRFMEELYLDLLQEKPNFIKNLWASLHKNEAGLERFISQFSTPTIHKTIRMLSPLHVANIIHWARDCSTLQPSILAYIQQKQGVSMRKKIPHIEGEQALLKRAMQEIIMHRNVPKRDLMARCLQTVSDALEISYPTLLAALSTVLEQQPALNDKLNDDLRIELTDLYESYLRSKAPTHTRETPFNKMQTWQTDNEHHGPDTTTLSQAILSDFSSVNEPKPLQQIGSQWQETISAMPHELKPAFRLLSQLIKTIPQQSHQENCLLSQLTKIYLDKEKNLQQDPERYMAYLIRKLPLYVGLAHIQKAIAMLHKQEQKLQVLYSPILLKTLFAHLQQQEKSAVHQEISYQKITQSLEALITAKINDKQKSNLINKHRLADLLKLLTDLTQMQAMPSPNILLQLSHQLAGLLGDPSPSCNQEQLTQDRLADWLKQSIAHQLANPNESNLQNLKAQVSQFVNNPSLDQPTPITANKQNHDRLLTTLCSLEATTQFFLHDDIPKAFSNKDVFLAVLGKRINEAPTFKKSIHTLLQQPAIRKALLTLQHKSTTEKLVHHLLQLENADYQYYIQVLIKADVLRASDTNQKINCLNEILLEMASEQITYTAKMHFLQRLLLGVALHSKMPQQEVFRRVKLSIAQHKIYEKSDQILQQLTAHSFLFQSNQNADIAISLMPIQQQLPNLNELKAPHQLVAYQRIMEQMGAAVESGAITEATNDQIRHQLSTLIPNLAEQKKEILVNHVTKKLQNVLLTRKQNINTVWMHFITTGQLKQGYDSALGLFYAWLQWQKPISGVANKTQKKILAALQEADIRNRLVNHLPTQALEKIAYLLTAHAGGNRYMQMIQEINTVLVQAPRTTLMGGRNIITYWWNAILKSLTQLHAKNIPNTLTDFFNATFLTLAKSLAIPAPVILNQLIRDMKEIATKKEHVVSDIAQKPKNSISFLKNLQTNWEEKVQQEASVNWPEQPLFQQLHRLSQLGLYTLGDFAITKLSNLQEQTNSMLVRHPQSIAHFLFNYPNKETLSQQLTYYFPPHLIVNIIACLDAGANTTLIESLIMYLAASTGEGGVAKLAPWKRKLMANILHYFIDKNTQPFEQTALIRAIFSALKEEKEINCREKITEIVHFFTKKGQDESFIMDLLEILGEEMHDKIDLKHLNVSNDQQANHTTALAFETEKTLEADEDTLDRLQQRLRKKQAQKLAHPLADTKIYIKNSGLVFLWPFITHFLEQQDILIKGKFLDKIDRNNAIHALQYAVTGSLSTPEWRLTLNKLLCGMAYDGLPFGGYYLADFKAFAKDVLEKALARTNGVSTDLPPVLPSKHELENNNDPLPVAERPEEILLLEKNTKNLLETVLLEWKDLKQLEQFEPYQAGFDLTALQTYILQRPGILQYVTDDEQGYWHLTITWEAYDHIILKTPWPIDKISLPFMQEELVVFWLPK